MTAPDPMVLPAPFTRGNQRCRLRILDYHHVFVELHAVAILLVVRQENFLCLPGQLVFGALVRDALVLDRHVSGQLRRVADDDAVADVDELLALRGLQPKRSGNGHLGGYRPAQREAMLRAVLHVQNLWVHLTALEVYQYTGLRPRRRQRQPTPETIQSRVFTITDLLGHLRPDGPDDLADGGQRCGQPPDRLVAAERDQRPPRTGLVRRPTDRRALLRRDREREMDDLERDRAAQGGIERLVDDPHHAAADLAADLVAADRRGRGFAGE